jgi:hypothetical protein
LIHIESRMHPGRPCCDPQYTERRGLQAQHLPLIPGVNYCPECVRVKRDDDPAAEHAARKDPRYP